jgi:putative nucleotidyltransferase with HDIG domain
VIQTKIQQIMTQVNSFPSMPVAAEKLLLLLNDPEMNVSQVEAVLRLDPGLTANVLKMTNSAYFGLPSKIGSVRQAVVLMGSQKLVQLVLASCVQSVMEKPVAGYDLPPGELWRHAIAVSVAAEALVKELKIPGADVVFTAALLHDVGKLVLGGFVKDELENIEDQATGKISFEAAEQCVLGTNHAEVGSLILKNWSLPPEIVEAVQWHHTPAAVEESDNLTNIVHVADVLSLMIGIGVGREGLQYQLSLAATQRLGLTRYQLEKVASQTLQGVSELSDVFGAT